MGTCKWQSGGARKRRKSKSKRRRTKRGRSVKGSWSKTHSGKNYMTRKSSKFYNRDGHRQRYSLSGLRDSPFGMLLSAGSDRRRPSRRSKRSKRSKRRSKGSSRFRASRCFSF